jgi:ParB family chromosome partitioning protein
MQVEHIALNKLASWPGHVRRGDVRVDDLVASIAAHGLLEPLIVRPNGAGTYEVVAGNRRLVALNHVHGDPATPIPCSVLPAGLDDDKLLEISLAENVTRLDMHPLDECEAFAKLAGAGKNLPAVAAAFNVSERFVKQRLILAALPAKARELYRAGKIEYTDAVALARLAGGKEVAKALKLAKDMDMDVERAAHQFEREAPRFYVKHARFLEDLRVTEDLFDEDEFGKPMGAYYVDTKAAMEAQLRWLGEEMVRVQNAHDYAFTVFRPDEGYYQQYRAAADGETKGVGLVCWVEHTGEIHMRRSVSLQSERQAEKAKAKKATKDKLAKGEPVNAGEISAAFGQDLEQLHRLALIVHMAKRPQELADNLGLIVSFNHRDLRDEKNPDLKALARTLLEKVVKDESLAAQVAAYIHWSDQPALRKHLAKTMDLSVIEWPKAMLKRLPRVMLDAEAKALKLKVEGEITKEQLVERIWKHRPKGWVPIYARL